VTRLRIIRVALLVGVLGFGAVVWFLRRQGSSADSSTNPQTLVTVGRIVWGAALLVCIVLFLRTKQGVAGRPGQLNIAAWAAGEATALFGGVVFLLTGVYSWYLMGVFFLGLTFLAFPAERVGG
jgi:hypothetical protein